MKKTGALLFGFSIIVGLLLFAPTMANAQTGANPEACKGSSSQFFEFPTWYKYLNPEIQTITPDSDGGEPYNICSVSFDAGKDIPKVLLAVFEIIMRILGIVAVVMVVWGGFQYITSQGEPEATKNARNTIVNALIGVGVAISATAIVNLIGNNLIK